MTNRRRISFSRKYTPTAPGAGCHLPRSVLLSAMPGKTLMREGAAPSRPLKHCLGRPRGITAGEVNVDGTHFAVRFTPRHRGGGSGLASITYQLTVSGPKTPITRAPQSHNLEVAHAGMNGVIGE